jgi:ADP-ribose pyrophosphatase
LLIRNDEVLISKEYFKQRHITKFPGGGLLFGEGLTDCLIREFKEELGISINVRRHFYTTDFFNPSAFEASKQVISIYYVVDSDENIQSGLLKEVERSEKNQKEFCYFKWLSLKKMREDDFTFKADRIVAGKLRDEFRF